MGERWREFGAQMRLAGPVVALQVGMFAMGAVDSAFLGRFATLPRSWLDASGRAETVHE